MKFDGILDIDKERGKGLYLKVEYIEEFSMKQVLRWVESFYLDLFRVFID